MIELLVVIGIMVVMGGLVLLTSRIISASQARSTARQQIALIAAAIDGSAGFWPKWQQKDNTGRSFTIADRGWPDYVPGRLFAAPPFGPFTAITGFNNDLMFIIVEACDGLVHVLAG